MQRSYKNYRHLAIAGDTSPFGNGDFYMNASLESEKFNKIQPSEPVGGSHYVRAQFQPVSARESVKVLYKTMRCDNSMSGNHVNSNWGAKPGDQGSEESGGKREEQDGHYTVPRMLQRFVSRICIPLASGARGVVK